MPSNQTFENSVTEAYCSDKFTFNYNEKSHKLDITPKNTAENILNNNSELEIFEKQALEAYREAFEKYKPEEIAFCFDGGKDGHVVFHLLKNFLQKNKSALSSTIKGDNSGMSDSTEVSKPESKILTVNIIQNDTDLLPEPRELVKNLTEEYSSYIKYQEYTNLDIKSALYKLKDDHSGIKAIFMGVRRTDNVWYKDMTVFQRTDQGWPDYVRINPIVDWSYPCVWAYLLKYGIKYCGLYDEGYTSLGKKSNSVRNEHLKVDVEFGEGSRKECYLPAYCLPSAEFERFKR